MKSNIHKKMTFEDKFDRKYACWVKNNRRAWHFWKRRNRRQFRKIIKADTEVVKNDLSLQKNDRND